VDDLIRFGSLTQPMAEFLRACVQGRLNVIVSGGTGSGKTTLLNVLSNFIPDDERIVTIEDSAELQLAKPHVVRLEARPPDPDGVGRVTIRDLVINALRMRPERIVVGECRGAEALDMLQAMNTGHDGSLTTLHANTPRDAISRLETMCLMAGIDFPVKIIREQIASAIDLIVQTARVRDGSRKITQITEVQGMEGDVVVMQPVFHFIERGATPEGRVIGEMANANIRPKFIPRLEARGIHLPPEIFTSNASRK
jgi:pilus assembly protein CpaF